jgi:hypothetical protein
MSNSPCGPPPAHGGGSTAAGVISGSLLVLALATPLPLRVYRRKPAVFRDFVAAAVKRCVSSGHSSLKGPEGGPRIRSLGLIMYWSQQAFNRQANVQGGNRSGTQ